MSVEDNKATIVAIYEAMTKGDAGPFSRAFAPDLVWRVTGSISWSRRFEGVETVRRELFAPLFSRFASTYSARLISIMGEGDLVVAEIKGDVIAKSGERYDNDYCFIFRFRDGKIIEVIEYGDTALEDRVLGAYDDAVSNLTG